MPARSRNPGLVAWALAAALLAAGSAPAEVYRFVDDQGVVHLTDSPTSRSYAKYRPTIHGSGKGISIITRRSSILGLGRREIRYAMSSLRLPEGRPEPSSYDALIERAALRHGVPAALVKAVVKTESNFQRHAVSSKGAQGLMQLMPATAADLGVEDAFSAEENVTGGTRYLRAMLDRYGDWKQALAAYNAGPGAVDQYGGIPPYQETRQYVERVLQYYRRYDGDFPR
ncbi:MAG: lytic transglycosylase domain-containing protein [Deltaproteobacteria bacterium]|nr:lytic transglycosylase domain-containing protein [Deltaproteobacteria bacterium]